MFGIGNLLNKAKKVENKNIMEAIVAGCLLVAAADGTIGREETDKMEAMLNANELLAAFKGNEIRKTVVKYTAMLEAAFAFGKKKMLDEIEQIADNPDHCEEVMIAMVVTANSDGNIDDAEKAILVQVGKLLRQNLADYGLA